MLNLKDPKGFYLIAEIGINHNGDLQTAKRLVDAVSACGWNCAKFQKRDIDVCIPEAQKKVPRDTPWGRMSYYEYKKRLEFGKKEYDYLDKYCGEKPLNWTASVWDLNSLRFLLDYDVPFIKIPSALLTDLELVAEAAKSKKPLIVSTGMSSLEEIDAVVETLSRHTSDFALMHSNSSYPAPQAELNLLCIPSLKKRYGCVVGYSGHEQNVEPTVYACVLGARIIERHITLSHTMWGSDHAASLEVHAMDLLRKRICDIDAVLGDGKKRVTEGEKKVKVKLRPSPKNISRK